MTKKRQWGVLLLLLLAIFAIRCSFSVGNFHRQGRSYASFRSPIIVFDSPFVWAPAPSPNDSNSTSPLANNTLVSRQHSNSSLPLVNATVGSHLDSNSSLSLTNNTVTSPQDEDLLVEDPILSAYPTQLPDINKVPKVQPLWRYLVNYLRRPGVPNEASKAMREGLRAWRDINKTMIDEASERANSSSHKVDTKCPYFVSALNAIELRSVPFLLPIPCGLVLDSSVTVVGTPGVKTGEFSLELIGSELFEEGDEPVVFHLSVRLRGDQITENPSIVQNTWTAGGDWQTEQRCPVLPECPLCGESAPDGKGLHPILNGLDLSKDRFEDFTSAVKNVATSRS